MTETIINFIYEGKKIKIYCKKDEFMKDIYKKYIIKINKEIKDIFFLYNGNIINGDIKLEQINNKDNEISILVFEYNQNNIKQNFNQILRSKKGITSMKMSSCPSFQTIVDRNGWGQYEQSQTLFYTHKGTEIQTFISNYNQYVILNNVIEDILERIEDKKTSIEEIGALASLIKKLNDDIKNINPKMNQISYFKPWGDDSNWIGECGGFNRCADRWNAFANTWNNKIPNNIDINKRDNHISFLYETFCKRK